MERMKVFISWSGPMAMAVAKVWAELIEETFDTVDAFISDDIEPGYRGLDEIKAALDGTNFAIVVVTKHNEKAPWLNFEAGAISKQFPGNPVSRVIPCLVDFSSPAQLTTPLKQFQGRILDREGVEAILSAIATQLDFSWIKKQRQFGRGWTDYFEGQFAKAAGVSEPSGSDVADGDLKDRSQESMVQEILELLRESNRAPSIRKVRPVPGSLIMKQISASIYQFLRDHTTDAVRVQFGCFRDPAISSQFYVYVNAPGLSSSEARQLAKSIHDLKNVADVLVGTTSDDYIKEISDSSLKDEVLYPF